MEGNAQETTNVEKNVGANPCPVNYGTPAQSAPAEVTTSYEAQDGAGVSAPAGEASTNEVKAEQPANNSTPAWMAQLPKELRSDESLAKYRTMGEAIKDLKSKATSGNEVQARQGEEVGTEENTPVNYENFNAKLDEGFDPFGGITEGLVNEFRTNGISQDKAEALIGKINDLQKDNVQRFVEEGLKYTEAECKKQWGAEYNAKRVLMAKGYQALGDMDGSLQKALDESGASLAPAMWEVMARVGKMVSEDKAVSSQKGSIVTDKKDNGIPVQYNY